MRTEAQIAANRRNAKKSTGPRTQAGKSASSANAVKSGLYAKSLIIRDEDPAELTRLAAEYYDEFRPATPRERDLVDGLVYNQWLIRRLRRTEADIHAFHFDKRADNFDGRWSAQIIRRNHPLADAFETLEKQLVRVQARVNALERSSRNALKELRDLRKAAAPAAGVAEAGEIGFVPPQQPQPSPPAPAVQSPTPNPPSPPAIGFVPPHPPQPTPRAAAPQSPAQAPQPQSPGLPAHRC